MEFNLLDFGVIQPSMAWKAHQKNNQWLFLSDSDDLVT